MNDIVLRSKILAVESHDSIGHKRKYTKESYWHHTFSVASIVSEYSQDEDIISAAILHDILEDVSWVTEDIIGFWISKRVASLVVEVTDISKPEDGNRKTRKHIDKCHLAQASANAQTIKLADLIDNTISILEHDHHFAKLYLEEKEALLKVLNKGNTALYERARKSLFEAKQKLALSDKK